MPRTAEERAQYKREWARRNDYRIKKRRHEQYWKNPEQAKAARPKRRGFGV